MKPNAKTIVKKAVAVAALFCMTVQPSLAALLNLTQTPLFAGANIPPKVMLTISKDQQLYKKAYNDYSDLDGDNVIETTYKHSIDYYGYFDPTKCYTYQNGLNRFEPARVSAAKLCPGEWSGNFLNWVSMSRMDAVRKLLYGGLRSTDEKFADRGANASTVLERSYLPSDAHAWAKYYNPGAVPTADQPAINQLTPFNPPVVPTPTAATTTSSFAIPAADGDVVMRFSSAQGGFAPGDQIKVARTASPGNYFIGAITAINVPGTQFTIRVDFEKGVVGSGSDTAWTLTNLSSTGISFCNVTMGSATGADKVSHTNTQPPLIRVASGNFGLWNANERWQCYWFEERNNFQGGFTGGLRSNGNQAAFSEMNASAENPSRVAKGLGTGSALGEYIARVWVCKEGLEGSEKCKRYPNGTLKPIGLLQEYGDRQRIHFGLMTGSYTKNISGGVLRKNIGNLVSEINIDTDGTFVQPYRPPSSPRAATSAVTTAGIINTLNYMRIYGYDYQDGSYLDASGDSCTYQLTNITEGSCTSWGNPMSEIFFEAMRYFASPKDGSGNPVPTSAYTYTNSGSKDNHLGLPLATWTDPVSPASQYCAPLNVLAFNASVSTNDDDLRTTTASSINGGSRTMAELTNRVGANEGITGNSYFAGKLVGSSPTPPGSTAFELCTAKTISALGDVSGICPEGPTLAGSYLMAGIAHHAKTNRVRTDITVPATDTRSLKVSTYAVQLATNVPTLTIPVPGSTTKKIVIQPIYRLDLSGGGRGFGGGALVDMRIVRLDVAAGTGKVYVNWEDSEQGGDYDQDMWGTIEWSVDAAANTIKVTTNAVSASTANPQGFGYVVSGTTKDGPHFHSGIYNFNFTDPSGVLGCTNCNLNAAGTGQRGPQSVTYTMTGTPANQLKDPMWYAAKYGGFSDVNGNGVPDGTEWDLQKTDGTPGPDEIPDNYFLVTNPLGLEVALTNALNKIIKDASGTALAANSTSQSTLTALYQARFNTGDWSGQLLAYKVDPATGDVNATAAWDASQTLLTTTPNNRVMLTYDDRAAVRDGIAFRWPTGSCSLTVCTELNRNPDTNLNDGRGQLRLNYLRGDRSLETGAGAIFRPRASVLGDIVDSSPIYIGAPASTVLDQSYAAFRNTHKDRPAMVYVGANDGALHGFEASPTGTGKERLAYIPSKTFTNLNDLTSINYVHKYFVNGTPEVQDAFFKTSEDATDRWRTVLVSGLAAGGKSIFALDVTNPDGGGNAPAFTEANANKIVLWEFNDSDDLQLGYTFGKPLVRKMANGRWAAIVSGGYNNSDGDSSAASTTGKAHLFIIFLDGPTGAGRTWRQILSGNNGDYIRINTGIGSAATPNGLAQPFAADITGDGSVDYIYAGDLYGNFWKFDVTSATAADWASASNRVSLFTAKDPITSAIQPITSGAEGTVHPTGRGFVVTFGTGKYLEFSDTVAPFQQQSFYGIWDKNDPPSGSGISAQTKVTGRSQLLEQSIDEVTSGSDVFRVVSENPPNWTTHMGWVMDFDLPSSVGERVIASPLVVAARLIFATHTPSNDPCSGGMTSFVMVVNPSTGGRISTVVLNTDRDPLLNVNDKITFGGTLVYVSGLRMASGASGSPVVVRSGGGGLITSPGPSAGGVAGQGTTAATAYTGSQSGVGPKIIKFSIGLGTDIGRVTWREVLKQ